MMNLRALKTLLGKNTDGEESTSSYGSNPPIKEYDQALSKVHVQVIKEGEGASVD